MARVGLHAGIQATEKGIGSAALRCQAARLFVLQIVQRAAGTVVVADRQPGRAVEDILSVPYWSFRIQKQEPACLKHPGTLPGKAAR